MPDSETVSAGLPATQRYHVLGTPLEATSYEELIEFCKTRSRQPGCIAVDFSNTQIVTMRRHEPAFREISASMDYFVPDGMPLIWCLNRMGARLKDRVYGPTFMRRCVLATPEPFTHYFLGGSEECLARMRSVLLKENPRVKIVGAHHGYFRPEEDEQIVAEINRLSPDFIWVGLGTPKQHAWIYKNKAQIQRGILFPVGFAFDAIAGTKRDAPAWMQKRGLTWLFRILSEPRRLFGRYLRYNSLFIFYLLKDWLLSRDAS